MLERSASNTRYPAIRCHSERRAIRVIAGNAPGVRKVIDHPVFVEASTATLIEAPPEG